LFVRRQAHEPIGDGPPITSKANACTTASGNAEPSFLVSRMLYLVDNQLGGPPER
jgi:hypothetical protein